MSKLKLKILLLLYFCALVTGKGNANFPLPDDFYDEIEEPEDNNNNQDALRFMNEAFATKLLGDEAGAPRFSCLSCDDSDCSSDSQCHHAVRCYTSHVRDTTGEVRKTKGCVRKAENAVMYCKVASYDGRRVHEESGSSAQYAIQCCKGEMCNNDTEWPILPDVPVLASDDEDGELTNFLFSVELILAVAIPIVCLTVIVVIIFFTVRRCHRKKMEKLATSLGFAGLLDRNEASVDELVGLRPQPVGDSTLREFRNESDMTSGSGAGMPHLVPRTLAKQIQLGERIGKGRYGEVWRSSWNGDQVAVKIFFSRDEDSWQRETQIYTTVLLRHDNILGYVGSDCTSLNSCTQLWLVTHYYPLGSLYDYLNRDVPGLTSQQALKIMSSSISGLVHLHIEIFGTQGKPSIAHRDIKSKNILVREDGTCVIADFGLAVMQWDKDATLDEHQNSRVGTKRYMSPEVLDLSIERNKTIDAFRQADVYAFALVMWEVLRRTRNFDFDEESADTYALPFHNDVGPDPSFEEMRKVVCVDNRRPEISPKWLCSQFMSSICLLMRECWQQNPMSRLPALRIKKKLVELYSLQNTVPPVNYVGNKFDGISE